MNREQAVAALEAAGYSAEAAAMAANAERWPGNWQYTRDRHRATVKHMPSGNWEVVDCAESEERIAALARSKQW
jgi:hypothetical protein